jgi:enamine deaminase RidA (YjgF/YER057c/UK114 family)
VSVEYVDVVNVGGGLELGRVVRSGAWTFCNGVLGFSQDVSRMLSSDRRALESRPVSEFEAEALFDVVEGGLRSAGASFDHLVKLEQYYADVSAVDPYHVVRTERLRSRIPPSTSVVMKQLSVPEASFQLDAVAYNADGAHYSDSHSDEVPAPAASSGYFPALRADHYVFVAGQMAVNMEGTSLATEAVTSPGHLFQANATRLQARYVLDKLRLTLESAGASVQDIAAAQVYLYDINELPVFDSVWRSFLRGHSASRLVMECTALGLRDGILEVNLLSGDGAISLSPLAPTSSVHSSGEASSVRLGDLVLLSGMMAASRDGKLDDQLHQARFDRTRRPPAVVETELIVDLVESELDRHGLQLRDIVRIKQFHTDIRDFRACANIWSRRLGGPVPISAVECGSLALPSRSVLAEVTAVVAPDAPADTHGR